MRLKICDRLSGSIPIPLSVTSIIKYKLLRFAVILIVDFVNLIALSIRLVTARRKDTS